MNFGLKVILVWVVAGMIGWSFWKLSPSTESLKSADAACRIPRLVSEVDGLKLYVVRDGCASYAIYFSSSGTQTSRQECHWVGKVRTCKTITERVPNR